MSDELLVQHHFIVTRAALESSSTPPLNRNVRRTTSATVRHMSRWKIWRIAAAMFGLASGYTALNFIATIHLGYDAYPGGKEIITRFGYATLVLVLGSIMCALLAWRSRRVALRASVDRGQ